MQGRFCPLPTPAVQLMVIGKRLIFQIFFNRLLPGVCICLSGGNQGCLPGQRIAFGGLVWSHGGMNTNVATVVGGYLGA